ncbi:PIN domain-containing protein [Riemerella anatipestifer]|uniref:type II toxin-antitoxin system VapC family toxin n=1 Tax=Riemerella anatipestifer TaxID=34085 RepID=UPI00129EC7F8|nr:PIN domain-containing protein [Riemerella anatipestifer]MRM82656.1 PIN domain-containing protein [Riemerella anatipestifer]
MERVFVDTNIVLDLLEKRENFYQEAQELFTMGDQNKVKLFISALTIANVHYLLFKHLKMEARKAISKFKVLVEVLPIDDKIVELSLASDFTDFEDAIQYYTAIEHGMEVIISRNKKDFKNISLPVLTANEYLKC